MNEIINSLNLAFMLGATATQEGYGPDVTPPKPPEGELPFTGVEVLLMGIFGLILIGSGVVLKIAAKDAI